MLVPILIAVIEDDGDNEGAAADVGPGSRWVLRLAL